MLGGLNEGTWPPETRSDPWLSRPMRARSRPRSARSAASASPRTTSRKAWAPTEVILARAAKVAGAPTVTSRFVQRIAALAGEARWNEVLARGNHYLDSPARSIIRRR